MATKVRAAMNVLLLLAVSMVTALSLGNVCVRTGGKVLCVMLQCVRWTAILTMAHALTRVNVHASWDGKETLVTHVFHILAVSMDIATPRMTASVCQDGLDTFVTLRRHKHLVLATEMENVSPWELSCVSMVEWTFACTMAQESGWLSLFVNVLKDSGVGHDNHGHFLH